jgi:acetyl esterase/lipase
MKKAILSAALICAAYFANAQTPTPPPGVTETYKVVNGMNIQATVFNVDDSRTHRVAIVIHGGGYSAGTMETDVAQELSQYGFMGVAIEYRLAPPHLEMNTPVHPFPGQNNIHDDGHYPEQTDDVRDAIVHYRNDSRSNRQVVVIGGSAGGSHALYLAGTGTPGNDMPDLAVLLSCGVSNFTDPNQYALDCIAAEVCPHEAVANYLNIPDPAPNPPVGSALELAQDGSPTQLLRVGMCPFWAMCSSKDSLGIPTSTGFNIHSYLPDNTQGVLENGENGIVPRALAIGLRESTATVPEANSFKATIVPMSVHEHSFDYWEQVKNEVIPWISAPIPPPGGTPTPTETPSATPTPTSTATPTPTVTPTPSAATAMVADFNGDGHPDWVVRNVNTQQTVLVYMNNNVVIGAAYGPTLVAGSSWGLRSLGDFNHDGHPDYALFNSSSGQTAIWYLSGPTLIGGAFGPSIPIGWALVATADFNGDGYPDYVLYNAGTRQTAIWYLNNNTYVSSAFGPTLPPGWSLVAP